MIIRIDIIIGQVILIRKITGFELIFDTKLRMFYILEIHLNAVRDKI